MQKLPGYQTEGSSISLLSGTQESIKRPVCLGEVTLHTRGGLALTRLQAIDKGRPYSTDVKSHEGTGREENTNAHHNSLKILHRSRAQHGPLDIILREQDELLRQKL